IIHTFTLGIEQPNGGNNLPPLIGRIDMIAKTERNLIRQRVHTRIREKLAGTTERPRLNVYRSLNHIYAQVIDASKGVTLASASTLAGKINMGGNIAAAKEV